MLNVHALIISWAYIQTVHQFGQLQHALCAQRVHVHRLLDGLVEAHVGRTVKHDVHVLRQLGAIVLVHAQVVNRYVALDHANLVQLGSIDAAYVVEHLSKS